MAKEDKRGYLEAIKTYAPAVDATWGQRLERALEPQELNNRSQHVLLAALGSLVHQSLRVIEHHLNEAFNEGSNIAELLESVEVLAYLEGGGHARHDGLAALQHVITRREAAGLPTPRRGAPLPETEFMGAGNGVMVNPMPDPPVFPHQRSSTYPHYRVMETYDPELWAALLQWNEARFRLRKGLTWRMKELLTTGVDAVIRWPMPLLDKHVHDALNAGSNVQEIVEVVLLCADGAQGARESNIAGRQLAGGVEIILHGLAALDRVVPERAAAHVPTALHGGEAAGTRA